MECLLCLVRPFGSSARLTRRLFDLIPVTRIYFSGDRRAAVSADEAAAEALVGALGTKIFGFRVQGRDGAGPGKAAGAERHRIGCAAHRSDERRVGTECVGKWRSRVW